MPGTADLNYVVIKHLFGDDTHVMPMTCCLQRLYYLLTDKEIFNILYKRPSIFSTSDVSITSICGVIILKNILSGPADFPSLMNSFLTDSNP